MGGGGMKLAALCSLLLWTCAYCHRYTAIEEAMLKDYQKSVRPVKSSDTVTKVNTYFFVNHIEKLDEVQQTLNLHGWLTASWSDEYLSWRPADHNGTGYIHVDSWKIWRPDLALFNSAEGNSWNLNTWRYPAYVSSNGLVYLSYLFSFKVACVFDFSAFPYDRQRCPVVIGDWVYDVSAVNLSMEYASTPMWRLSWKEMEEEGEKKSSVAGWRLAKAEAKHMYWGPDGLVQDVSDTDFLNRIYWSCMEFWLELERERPYFGVVDVLPCLVSAVLTLVSFWIDQENCVLLLLTANLLLDTITAWDLQATLPPGNGSIPKIAVFFGFNMSMTLVAFVLNALIHFVQRTFPDLQMPLLVAELSARLAAWRGFQARGLSFDPQELTGLPSPASTHSLPVDTVLPDHGPQDGDKPEADRSEEEVKEEAGKATSEAPKPASVEGALYVARRGVFFLFLFLYAVVILYCWLA